MKKYTDNKCTFVQAAFFLHIINIKLANYSTRAIDRVTQHCATLFGYHMPTFAAWLFRKKGVKSFLPLWTHWNLYECWIQRGTAGAMLGRVLTWQTEWLIAMEMKTSCIDHLVFLKFKLMYLYTLLH